MSRANSPVVSSGLSYRKFASSCPILKMPPKASSSKRKAKADESEPEYQEDEDDNSQEQTKGKKSQSAKKAKVQKEPVKPLDPSVPTNITFPINLTLEAKPAGTTRLACWNVCGINSCIKKGFDFYVKAENPDVLILTETKVDKEVDHDMLKSKYPVIWDSLLPVTCVGTDEKLHHRQQYRIWGADPKKGHSGTAVFSKIKPKTVKMGLPTLDEATTQGRCLTL